ncbi:hypothetical protein GGR50DRAFT_691012 [Xylaria sp. CBS 124048]|nr:hypothetical protein GGR50DRAFT_691012 [Xylaria sp. CBS 124048]
MNHFCMQQNFNGGMMCQCYADGAAAFPEPAYMDAAFTNSFPEQLNPIHETQLLPSDFDRDLTDLFADGESGQTTVYTGIQSFPELDITDALPLTPAANGASADTPFAEDPSVYEVKRTRDQTNDESNASGHLPRSPTAVAREVQASDVSEFDVNSPQYTDCGEIEFFTPHFTDINQEWAGHDNGDLPSNINSPPTEWNNVSSGSHNDFEAAGDMGAWRMDLGTKR